MCIVRGIEFSHDDENDFSSSYPVVALFSLERILSDELLTRSYVTIKIYSYLEESRKEKTFLLLRTIQCRAYKMYVHIIDVYVYIAGTTSVCHVRGCQCCFRCCDSIEHADI